MKPINPVLKNFIINCVNALDSLSEPELVYYLADIVIPDEVINIFCNEFLTHICQHSQSKHFDSNHLEYCANKLVNFGFAPRSTVYTEVGAFQPLVCKNKSQLDKQNNYALTRYIHALDAGKRSELIKELMVALLIRYRIKPHVLQNQPKPIHRRAIDSNYPVPTTHKHTTKEKESPLKNFNTAQNMYQLTFFARKYAKENSKPEFTPQTEGKQYGG